MPRHAVISVNRLDAGLILAPERYDPRRRPGPSGRTLADVAEFVREQVAPGGPGRLERCLVLDTGDAQDGFLRTRLPVAQRNIGSTKKRVQPGDVIISRLRPYLRQIAYVDDRLADGEIVLLCSTEFFVLRGRDIAFLVPFLLSEPVQEVLALSQEGGHHPRFNEAALRALPLLADIDVTRDEISAAVIAAVESARAADRAMRALVERVSR